ncbi:MAG: DUF1624 domain-containing protein, partial [Clostridiales bacterium]|nr:DUF1624 domain-containing protein [Clostridiales bacterium]
LMVFHHLFFDLVEFLGAPLWLFSNPVFNFLHYVFAGLFIFLAGVSSRFSRSNIKRGLKTAAAAIAVTAATCIIGAPVLFGVLHLLAFCMLLYGLLGRVLERLPQTAAAVAGAVMVLVSALAVDTLAPQGRWLWPFGWTYPGFYSSDYFPIFPWVFVFLLGTCAGVPIRERALPEWFYETKAPVLPWIGRHALIIYLVHQPVLYGITMLIAQFVH